LNTSSLITDLDANLDAMESIFSIYAHFRVHEKPEWTTSEDMMQPPLTDLEKSVLTQLQEKATNLFASPVVRQRNYSMRKIYRLLSVLELLSLD
jgi:hypothetical protein